MEEKKSLLKEFGEFIARGNALSMAVGVVIGGAFTAIVNSLVDDLIMPLISLVTGGTNFADLKFVIKEATATTEETALTYGNFIAAIVNFLLVALVLFLIIKGINKVHKEKEAEPVPPTNEELLLTEIRDLLKEKK